MRVPRKRKAFVPSILCMSVSVHSIVLGEAARR
jgi:hypothetical protein